MTSIELRRAAGWTQTELAALLGVHTTTVNRWEKGKLAPSPWQSSMLEAFAFAIDLDSELGAKVKAVRQVEGAPAAVYALLHLRFRNRFVS